MVIRELTGEFVNYIACEDIQKEGRRFNTEVIWLGPKEDLEVKEGSYA